MTSEPHDELGDLKWSQSQHRMVSMGWGMLVGAQQGHMSLLGGALGGKARAKKRQEVPSEIREGIGATEKLEVKGS